MAKYYGKIGFVQTVENEDRPGIFEEKTIDVDCYGDVIKNSYRWQNGQGINDDLLISQQISILADEYVCQNAPYIRYAEYMGVKWKIINIEPQRPRLLLTLGGIYNA